MKKKIAVYTLLSSMMFSSIALSQTVHAESYSDKIEETQKQINQNQQNINRLDDNIRDLESQQSSTEAELLTVNNYIAANESKMQELIKQLEKSQKEHDQLLEEIKVLEENIAKRNEKLEGQARTVQVDGDPANYLEFIVQAESLTDVMGRVDIVSNLVRANKQMVQEQKEDKEQVEQKKTRTEETINQQNATAAKLEETASSLEQKRLEKEVLVAQLSADKATAQNERDAHMAEKAAAESRVAEYVSAQQEAERVARAAAAQRAQEEQQARQAAAEREVVAAATQRENGPAASQASAPAPSNNRTEAPAASNNQAAASSNSQNSRPAASSNTQTSAPAQSQPVSTPVVSKPVKEEPKKEAPKKETPAPAPATTGNVISYAKQFTGKGIKYVWGGGTPNGFDCSGFTSYVFKNTRGIGLARTAAAQYANSKKVSSPVAGDLVFFAASGSRVTHVGIYMGGGQFIGSQTSTGPAVASLNGGYWGPKVVGYGRY